MRRCRRMSGMVDAPEAAAVEGAAWTWEVDTPTVLRSCRTRWTAPIRSARVDRSQGRTRDTWSLASLSATLKRMSSPPLKAAVGRKAFGSNAEGLARWKLREPRETYGRCVHAERTQGGTVRVGVRAEDFDSGGPLRAVQADEQVCECERSNLVSVGEQRNETFQTRHA
jgi:hypothetical protein